MCIKSSGWTSTFSQSLFNTMYLYRLSHWRLNITENTIVSFTTNATSDDTFVDRPTFMYNLDGKQAIRDKKKEEMSKLQGYTLVVIPYWWQNSERFVRATI